VSIKDNQYDILKREYDMVMLGKDLSITNGIIDIDTINAGLEVFKRYKRIMDSFSCEKYYCIGTSALRTANNANEFVNLVKKETGIIIDVISEEQEAKLSFFGALGMVENKENYVVLDIGGGSTELISCSDGKITSNSFLLGAARIKSIFWKSKITPTAKEYEKADQYIRNTLIKQNIKGDKKNLIGVAGTITTLASISKELEQYNPDDINNTILTLKKIKSMLLYIMRLDERERFRIPGMFPPQRANNIIAGIMVLVAVMEELNFNEITVKATCILEGIILENFFFNNVDK
jgi:exopolyphosphatase/guanosine-5'-triphosphate,3'-diphosphate pyrophosphatase